MERRVSTILAVVVAGAAWIAVARQREGDLSWLALVAGSSVPVVMVGLMGRRTRPRTAVAVAFSTTVWAVVAWFWLRPVVVGSTPERLCGSPLLPAPGVTADAGTPCFLLLADQFNDGAYPALLATVSSLAAWLFAHTDAVDAAQVATTRERQPSASSSE